MELVRHSYQFRSRTTERLYLSLSAYGGRVGFNAAAPLTPLVALADRRSPNDRGSIVLIRARKNQGDVRAAVRELIRRRGLAAIEGKGDLRHFGT